MFHCALRLHTVGPPCSFEQLERQGYTLRLCTMMHMHHFDIDAQAYCIGLAMAADTVVWFIGLLGLYFESVCAILKACILAITNTGTGDES